jgi:dUTP pyrophosphatase
MAIELPWAPINDQTVPPSQQPDSVGWDVFSYGEHIISPGHTKIIPLGFHAALPLGYAAFVWDRSSFGAKGLHVFREMITFSPQDTLDVIPFGGLIDWSYRGQWGVILHSFLKEPFKITHGMRVAQIVIQELPDVNWTQVSMEDLLAIPSERGQKGLGSSEGVSEETAQEQITAAVSNLEQTEE